VSARTKVQVVYTKACTYCGPTKVMWHELQKEHKFEYEEIDAETPEGQKLVEKFEIMAVPTTIIDGKVRFVGLPNKVKAEQIVEE
jgi:glutaredoxin